ncbi:unnamed protein product [Parnassius mnemosyne]|uniref:Uncharacterized protein n=1 Tax=Parnassius mnemosyne TaxID=213953 RepID=A0AAV1KW94_9NEOP
MADAIAARREARRRRILENSHNRLQLISGKTDDDINKDSPRRTPIPDQNVDIPFLTEVDTINTRFLDNGIINSEFETTGFTENDNLSDNREVTNDLAAFTLLSPEPCPTLNPSLVDKVVTSKYDIVLLSLLIQILYELSVFTFDQAFFFLPLILYIVTKLIFFPRQSNSSIANALLLLNGISAEKVKIIVYVMQLLMLISGDVCLYLFTIICIQSLSITLKDNFIT